MFSHLKLFYGRIDKFFDLILHCITANHCFSGGKKQATAHFFGYQPRHKTMISSSWGAPAAFTKVTKIFLSGYSLKLY